MKGEKGERGREEERGRERGEGTHSLTTFSTSVGIDVCRRPKKNGQIAYNHVQSKWQ